MHVKYPNVTVQLTGQDRNVFNLISIVSRALKSVGGDSEAFVEEVTSSASYDDAIQVIQHWVDIK